jgi:hypothetical protein
MINDGGFLKIRLAGEKASKGKSFATHKKNAATHLHYLLLAGPDFLVARGLLTTDTSVVFLVGTGGVSIRRLEVGWRNKSLYEFLYASIYRLYDPSHFADTSYTKTGFNKETSEATFVDRGAVEHVVSNPIHGLTYERALVKVAAGSPSRWGKY